MGAEQDRFRAPVGPPMAQVGFKHIAVVNFENGTMQIHPAEARGGLVPPLLLDDVLCIRDGNYAVIAALDTKTFKPLAPQHASMCCIADGVQYLAFSIAGRGFEGELITLRLPEE